MLDDLPALPDGGASRQSAPARPVSKTYELTVEWEHTGGHSGLPFVWFGRQKRVPPRRVGSDSSTRRCSHPPPDEPMAITLTPECRALRREVGPMAWAVLEDVALDAAAGADGVIVARTSAREVAAHLAIQPGTAAKALARLRERGLIALKREPGQEGRFGLSFYRLCDLVGIAIVADDPCVDRPHMAGTTSGRSVRGHTTGGAPADAGGVMHPAEVTAAPAIAKQEASRRLRPATDRRRPGDGGSSEPREKRIVAEQPLQTVNPDPGSRPAQGTLW